MVGGPPTALLGHVSLDAEPRCVVEKDEPMRRGNRSERAPRRVKLECQHPGARLRLLFLTLMLAHGTDQRAVAAELGTRNAGGPGAGTEADGTAATGTGATGTGATGQDATPGSRAAEPKEPASSPDIAPEHLAFFENRIRPVLIEHCYSCHSAEAKTLKAGLYLDSRAGWAVGGDSGPALVPGDPDASRLIRAIRYEDADLLMPPRAKLPERAIRDLVHWVQLGAPDPRDTQLEAKKDGPSDITSRAKEHWAWQPVRQVTPPGVQRSAWPTDDVDRFVLAKLEEAGLSPASEASREVFIRRVSFALTGLPPSPEEIRAFIDAPSETAHEQLVDRLLKSPHFGERWGQHWLDLVRYAETRGHEQDYPIAEAWRFRDYIIRAFNDDVPYDKLLTEHLAGDLLDTPRLHPEDRSDQSVQGTGFWHLGEETHSPVDIRGDEADRVANKIDVFSRTFLGLSVGCARCHDHKFDAISTRDYYALFGYLQSSSLQYADIADPVTQGRLVRELTALEDSARGELLSAFVALRRSQLERFPAYLRGARKVLAGAEIVDVAVAERLEATVLDEVVGFLETAAKNPGALLFPVAQAAAERAFDKARRVAFERWDARRQESDADFARLEVVKSIKKGERNYVAEKRSFREDDWIFNGARAAPATGATEPTWFTNGYRFRTSPRPLGTLLLGDSPDRPFQEVLESRQVTRNGPGRRFSGLVRTRTFEIVGDTLWYRYRGEGDVFLAVDSHRVVAGPLHGVVKQKLKGDGNAWRWHQHRVRDYIGHRVHVEFTPSSDSFAVDAIVFAERPPPDRFTGNAVVREALQGADSFAALATAFTRRAHEVLEARLAAPSPSGEPLSGELSAFRDRAQLLNWLLTADSLFEPRPELEARLRETFTRFAAQREALEKQIPRVVRALAMMDGDGEDEPVHVRGNHRTRSANPVPRSILTALRRPDEAPAPRRGSGRMQLARRMVARDNPLVSRVFVNRVWHHLFGRGLVPTVDDFGVMGQPPTHPELLDHLATSFVDDGWSLKRLIRRLVLSATYRMSSRPDVAGNEKDPENKLLHRMPIRRLDAEVIRDHLLAVSGRLDRTLFGPSVRVHITPFMRGNRTPSGSGPVDGNGRRSIYTSVERNHLSSMMLAFDRPIPFMALGRRSVSNAPAQPLILLNDPFVHQQAEIWAQRLLKLDGAAARLRDAYLWAFGRLPESEERAALEQFVHDQIDARGEGSELLVWKDLCHTLYNVKEFIFVR